MFWNEALEAFCLDSINLSSSTQERYKMDIRDFFGFCPKEVDKVSSNDVIEWHHYLKNKYKKGSVSLKMSRLRVFFKYLCEEHIRDDNPVSGIRIQTPDMEARATLTKDDYKVLMKATAPNIKRQVILSILYTGGLRPNELVKLKLDAIDWPRGVLLVSDDKKKKERLVPITYDCLTRLKRYLDTRDNDSQYVFPSSIKKGEPITISPVQRFIYNLKYKLEFNKPLSPQVFRYTYASNLWAAGFNLYEIGLFMGHDSIDMTKKYIECFDQSLEQNYRKYCH